MNNKKVELGDGEPSPPLDMKKCNLCGNYEPTRLWRWGRCPHCGEAAERSGAAQEVSPPSPEQPKSMIALQKWERDAGKPASCSEGNAFIDGFNAGFEDKWDAEYRRGKSEAEGDTRELKAALKECVKQMKDAASLLEMFPDDYGEVINRDYGDAINRAEKLLG